MPREHVEFIQSQALSWSDGSLGKLRPDVEQKTLSADKHSGAASLLVHYPAGFHIEDARGLAVAEEVLVLDGSVSFGSRILGRDSYGYFPAGTVHRSIASEMGAVVLTFVDGAPLPATGTATGSEENTIIDTIAMPWATGNPDSGLKHMGLMRKVLRDDPNRQERSLLLCMAPLAYPPDLQGVQISHPCCEEMYLLSGDIISEYGISQAGAYFWRPPEIPHGPHGSHGGAFMLIRFMEGTHRNDWTDTKRQFDLNPAYRPALPEGLGDVARLKQAATILRNY